MDRCIFGNLFWVECDVHLPITTSTWKCKVRSRSQSTIYFINVGRLCILWLKTWNVYFSIDHYEMENVSFEMPFSFNAFWTKPRAIRFGLAPSVRRRRKNKGRNKLSIWWSGSIELFFFRYRLNGILASSPFPSGPRAHDLFFVTNNLVIGLMTLVTLSVWMFVQWGSYR